LHIISYLFDILYHEHRSLKNALGCFYLDAMQTMSIASCLWETRDKYFQAFGSWI